MVITKRGASHFEMIISFVLFAGIVAFLFFFISPYKTNTIQESLLTDVYNSFNEQASTNLTTLFLKTDFDRSGCFSVDISGEVLNYELTNSVAYGVSNQKRKSMVSGNEISIEGSDKFFNVLISPIFSNDNLNGCQSTNDFTLGSSVERQILAYPRVIELAEEYVNDYSTLRGKLAVPPTYDFAIISEELGINMQINIPEEVDVLSKGYIDEILFDNGTIINVEFIVKVW